jgi:tight adherence protein C
MATIKNIFYLFIDNFNYYGTLLLTFIAVLTIVFVVMRILTRPGQTTEARLEKLTGKSKQTKASDSEKLNFVDQGKSSFASQVSKPLHKISSLDDRTARKKIRIKLVQAGYRSNQAVYNFLALKIILPVSFICFYLLTRIYYNFASEAILAIILLILLGYFTPTLWVFLMTKARQERIFKGLPDALDLMVVCVESGLGLDMTLKRVGEEIRPICKDLADEFDLANMEIKAGISRNDAFRNMITRTGSPEINSLMTVLIQTSKFGTSLATALRVHADSMRIKRRQVAEETAAKAAVKLIFPLVLFIFPAILVVLIGPGAIKIVKYLIPVLRGG